MRLPPRSTAARLLAALALAAAAPAAALAGPAVTLNGVPIDGATNQRFDSCAVVIDAQGNVHITAKGYAVKGEGAEPAAGVAAAPASSAVAPAAATTALAAPSAPPPPGARLARRYFLATEQSQPDGTQYDVEVFVNASWIRTLRSADAQAVVAAAGATALLAGAAATPAAGSAPSPFTA